MEGGTNMPQGILATVIGVAVLVFIAFCLSWLIHNPIVPILAVVAIVAFVVATRSRRRARNRV
jgi:CHASE2 domain-containing sensor protein